jgi:hypothetical protein
MKRVHYDGSFAAAAEALRACETHRVWIVFARAVSSAERAFLEQMCPEDANGSRGHFEGRKYVRHESVGSARFCDPATATSEDLISSIAHNDRIPDEEKPNILAMLRPCVRDRCGGACDDCRAICRIAEEYGIYDLEEALIERDL